MYMYNLPHIQCNQPKKINLSLEKCKPYTILMTPNGSVSIVVYNKLTLQNWNPL